MSKITNQLPIYKLVDGKLERIPEDKRDPKRRYGSVSDCSTGEQYLREYTDEEEREANECAAKWEAERPQREAEEKRQHEAAENFQNSLKYETRIVAFLDILGWKEAIARSLEEPELAKQMGIALKTVQGFVSMGEWIAQQERENSTKWPGDDRGNIQFQLFCSKGDNPVIWKVVGISQ